MNLPRDRTRLFFGRKPVHLSIFVSQEEPLFLSKGAMETVNGRLKREATSYPSRVREKKDVFCFVYSFPLTLVDREAGLFPHSLFYTPFIYYITPLFFTSLYILECPSKNRGCHNKSYFSSSTVKKESGIYYAITRFIPIVFRTSIRALYLPLSLLPLFIPIISR